MEENNLIVEGYQFSEEDEAKKAREELNKIHFFDSKMDYTNAENVLFLYKKILEERMFHTQVGMDYLRRLRRMLLEKGVPQEHIPQIPVISLKRSYVRKEDDLRARKRVEMTEENNMRRALRGSVMLNIALIILVIAMFYITIKSDNPNILNYKQNLLNQYASWEQELTEREEKVREAELQYHIGENP